MSTGWARAARWTCSAACRAGITSLAAAGDDVLYFTAGRTLYTWQLGKVGILSEGLGDVVCWRGGALYVLDTQKQLLLKLENLPCLEAMPQETP
jgi:hypothetical protein